MPTPPKPFSVLVSEKKSHRTKKELELRKKGEDELTSGKALKVREEVRNEKEAYKEFKRINLLLKGINKNDALYEPVVNRYCLIQAECKELDVRRQFNVQLVEELRNEFKIVKEELEPEQAAEYMLEFTKQIEKITSSILSLDKMVQQKRKMLLDIEKENVMTIASALRSIPKEEGKKESALLKALADD